MDKDWFRVRQMDKDDIIAYYVGQVRVHTFESLKMFTGA
jgi:hypothetical protein